MSASDLPKNAYPVMRASTEFFLRDVDLVSQMQGNDLVCSLIFVALWNANLKGAPKTVIDGASHADGSKQPIGVRELARRLNMPYATVRRHTSKLLRERQCVSVQDGLVVPSDVLRQKRNADILRKSYLNVIRLLSNLENTGFVKCPADMRDWSNNADAIPQNDENIIVQVGIESFLDSIKALGNYVNGDLIKGLVLTGIWTANVKHITNTDNSAFTAVIPDKERMPVNVLAIANSLRLPYETTRRHANALVCEKVCVRVGRRGLIVPAEYHRAASNMTRVGYNIAVDLVVKLQKAGLNFTRT